MAEPLVYKAREDLSDNVILHLSLYYIYVSPNPSSVASLLNQLHSVKPRIASQEIRSTYDHLHDTEHPVWVRARDMVREKPDELKRILQDEIGMARERWDVRVVKPVQEMARLRPSQN